MTVFPIRVFTKICIWAAVPLQMANQKTVSSFSSQPKLPYSLHALSAFAHTAYYSYIQSYEEKSDHLPLSLLVKSSFKEAQF
jgi:hypothetical protein